jgi:hypothetical protein
MPPRKLWSRRLADGTNVTATLFYDRDLSESTAEIFVKSEYSDDLAINLATAIREALDQQGAVVVEQET